MKNAISPMQASDLKQVAELARQLGYPNEMEALEARFAQLAPLAHHWLLVIRNEQGVQAWMHLERVFDLIEPAKLEIKAIVVNEELRGQGLGQQLIEHAQMIARENALRMIYLNCNIKRETTHKFYRQLGFQLERTAHFFEMTI
jgi:GNAT superfamily N-acetyltransferase